MDIKGKEYTKERWSEILTSIKVPIKNLYFKGDIELLESKRPKLAIVGSRRMTEYGAGVVKSWMSELVRAGVIIVSGFMYGVDQVAHGACVDLGGQTIAVLGWGIDWPVGEEDEKLYQRILQVDSLILSEYPEKTVPELWMFPQRNRIVAGIADAVLVIEAAEKSGSLITAKLALAMNKKLLAVPGRVDVKVAKGTNELIASGKAKAVLSARDVLREMGLVTAQQNLFGVENHDEILIALENGPLGANDLCRLLKIPVAELMVRITKLNFEGKVEESGGKYKIVTY